MSAQIRQTPPACQTARGRPPERAADTPFRRRPASG
jgi:hypothetical protein